MIARIHSDHLGSFDFKERILATPVIADGTMLIRTDNALYAFRAR